jgi:hypothetical protein
MARANPSAIWLRHELPVHRKRTRGRRSAAAIGTSRSAAATVRSAVHGWVGRDGVGERAEARGDLVRAQSVAHGTTLAPGGQHARALERLEVPRHDGEVDGAALRDLTHGAGAAATGDAGDEAEARRIGECREESRVEGVIEGIAEDIAASGGLSGSAGGC